MVYLIFSVLLSTSLFVGFKWFSLKSVNLLMALLGNYVACVLTVFIINRGLNLDNFSSFDVLGCMALGILFFMVFYAMAFASSHIGVGIAGASSKLSLIIPVMFGSFMLNETFDVFNILALILALLSVIILTYQPSKSFSFFHLFVVAFVFLGSGIIDVIINLLQLYFGKQNIHKDTAIAFIFLGALLSALMVIISKYRHLLKDKRSFGYGLILGVPNYFSIYFLIMALQTKLLNSNVFYMINNTAIMLCSFIAALLLFKEKINYRKTIGIALAVLAIYLSVK
jgi:drug/metabolite transporter (DMT)-like permease